MGEGEGGGFLPNVRVAHFVCSLYIKYSIKFEGESRCYYTLMTHPLLPWNLI